VAEHEENTILVCAVARNISSTLNKDFERINLALSKFKKVLWIVVESDSTDDSVNTLAKLSRKNPNFYYKSLGSLSQVLNSRTEILAHARNAYLEELLTNEKYSNIDLIAIADLNNLNSKLSPEAVESALALPNWGMCTANQDGPYYDIWALRHEYWSPNDCWEQLKFLRKYSNKKNLTLNSSVNLRMLKIPKDSEPIEVDSAFGGFAFVYKKFITNSSMYVGKDSRGREICEHVSFCGEVRKTGGRILVVPSLINTRYTDHSFRSTFIYSIFRNLGYPIKYLRKRLT
jgi:glycosyltransferase involved in cell wall biosynthesis